MKPCEARPQRRSPQQEQYVGDLNDFFVNRCPSGWAEADAAGGVLEAPKLRLTTEDESLRLLDMRSSLHAADWLYNKYAEKAPI